jgi:predicted  nucleic acid-binding Zn-ribbon protein
LIGVKKIPFKIASMLDVIEKLLSLQDKDQRLRALREELKTIPREIAAKEKLIADSAARLDAAKSRAKAIEVEKKTLQIEATAKRDQINKYKTQQMQTRKNEEFTAFAHEIASAEKVVSGIEDKELTLMEEAEGLKPQIAEAEKTYSEEKSRYDGQIATLKEKISNVQTRITELESNRPAALEGIEEDVLERYDRLFNNKNGRALVALENEICSGCHMKVTSQTSLAVRAEKTMTSCPQCGRILHLPA